MNAIGDTITVSTDEARRLRKEGWKLRPDIVTLMYVGKPDAPTNASIAAKKCWEARRKKWTTADHDFVARKLAEASCS